MFSEKGWENCRMIWTSNWIRWKKKTNKIYSIKFSALQKRILLKLVQTECIRSETTAIRIKYGQFHNTIAYHLESIGNLDSICLPIKRVYNTVKVSVDGDMSFAKILRDKQKDCSDYQGIELNFDIAHEKKMLSKI